MNSPSLDPGRPPRPPRAVARPRVALGARVPARLELWTQTMLALVVSSLLFILVFGLSLGTGSARCRGSSTTCSLSPA